MYSSTDLSFLHDPYFTLIRLEDNICEIQSNNTKHCWYIIMEKNYFRVYHKHTIDEKYHFHTELLSFEDCLLEIVIHDEFQLRKRRPAKHKQNNTFFERIIKAYQE